MNYRAEILLPKQHSKEPMWKRTVFLEKIDGKITLYIAGYRVPRKICSDFFVYKTFGHRTFIYLDTKKCINTGHVNYHMARIRRELEKKFNNLKLCENGKN